MRRKCAGFAREAEGIEHLIDGGGKLGEIGRGLRRRTRARAAACWGRIRRRENASRRARGSIRRERGANFGEFLRVRLAEKFQGEVHAFRAHPTGGAKGFQRR